MKISFDLNKSIEENAGIYYEKAKKAKKKKEGILDALALHEKKKKKLETEVATKIKEHEEVIPVRKKAWYEKLRWFKTSNNHLVIGGRDATTNEVVIKKHTDANDLVFHTDMAGSPFFVLKEEGTTISEEEIKEVADATCTFSRAFKLGLGNQQVFYVKPDQVTKEANPGEHLPKGAFMIRGKTNYADNKINCWIGIDNDGAVMAGPKNAIQKHCKDPVEIVQGKKKPSDVARSLKKALNYDDNDDIIRALPTGGMEIKTTRKNRTVKKK